MLKAAFKFNVGELDEELFPPPQADNRTIEAEHKIIDATFFGNMRYPNRKQEIVWHVKIVFKRNTCSHLNTD